MLIRLEQQDTKLLVKWKDLLSGQWKGPDPLLTSGRGCACIFPQDADSPIQIPDRLIHYVAVPQTSGSPIASITKEEGHSSAPPAAIAGNSRASGAAGRTSLAAGAQRTALAAVAPPASVCIGLAAAEPEAGSAREQGRRPPQGRQNKHRDPGKTYRAAAARIPTRK